MAKKNTRISIAVGEKHYVDYGFIRSVLFLVMMESAHFRPKYWQGFVVNRLI